MSRILCQKVLTLFLRENNGPSDYLLFFQFSHHKFRHCLKFFVQLPLRRNKIGKLICGILAVLLSAGMIYGTVAADAVQSALNKISGVVVEKQVTAVIVMKEDEAEELGDTSGYTFGTLANRDLENTQKIVAAIKEGLGDIRPSSSTRAISPCWRSRRIIRISPTAQRSSMSMSSSRRSRPSSPPAPSPRLPS